MRKEPTKKQLFNYEFLYREAIYKPLYYDKYIKEPNVINIENFYIELDRITETGWMMLNILKDNDFKYLLIKFFKEYHDVMKWDLMNKILFDFCLKRFQEHPIPMKFERNEVLYEFGTDIRKKGECIKESFERNRYGKRMKWNYFLFTEDECNEEE